MQPEFGYPWPYLLNDHIFDVDHVIKSCDHFLIINDIKNPTMWSSTIRLPNEHTDRNQRNFQNFKYLWNTNFLNSIFQISPKFTKMICTLKDIEYFLSCMIRFLNLIRNPLKQWRFTVTSMLVTSWDVHSLMLMTVFLGSKSHQHTEKFKIKLIRSQTFST